MNYGRGVFTHGQNISTGENSHSIRDLAWTSMENGLGRPPKGSSMGESVDGVAINGRFNAGDPSQFQNEGGSDTIRTEAGL